MTAPLLTCTNLTLAYARADKPILEGLNLTIHRGEFVILLGSNGSGKSSLLKILGKDLAPSDGHVQFDGHSLMTLTSKECAQDLVLLNQELRESLFFHLTVFENCLLWESRFERLPLIQYGKRRAHYENYLKSFHSKLPFYMDQVVGDLSGGEKQALLLGLCLKYPPKLLLLDEHTSALDPQTSKQLMTMTASAIEKAHVTTMMATHSLHDALAYGTRLIALYKGTIALDVSGPDKASLTLEDLLKVYD